MGRAGVGWSGITRAPKSNLLNTFYLVSNFDLPGIGSVAAAQANGPEARCRELENVTVPGLRIDAVKYFTAGVVNRCGMGWPFCS